MEYCSRHALDGMVAVKNRKCRTEGCGKIPSFGVAGTKTKEYCSQHAPDGMVDVKSKKCRTKERLRQDSVIWSGRYENEGVLLTARPGRDGQRQEQKVQNRRLR